MSKRTDIETILILGAGPIIIGQACEFDYSGAQACTVLRAEGYRTVLVNSNPATIMTDPELADATYIEPIHWQYVERLIEREKPDAILPTMGGQTALNCALDLYREGVLEAHGIELIGASKEAIDKAEDRELFANSMRAIGLSLPESSLAHSLEEALQFIDHIGFPAIIRPSFTLGGSGGGIAWNREEFVEICKRGFDLSPTHEVLLDKSLLGWKEFEMEVVRDKNDNAIVVCSIENFDPMGVHTGDSITVAPAQTLTDKEYQIMRDASLAVLREIGIESGGSNVQFAINPQDGRMMVIEMNPRVSRSSALASKATGFPIAKVAACLAVGYTLEELDNEVTGGVTPISFEPSIDYVVTKIPRFAFEKFPEADSTLTTQMKSIGEAMAIGRTFKESLHKAMRSLEIDSCGFEPKIESSCDDEQARQRLAGKLETPGPERLWHIGDAFRLGFTLEQIAELSAIDPWFLAGIEDLILDEQSLEGSSLDDLSAGVLRRLKRQGFSDQRLASLLGCEEVVLRQRRIKLGVRPVFKRVDTCAGEFATETAYMYSSYEEECEARPSQRRKIMVLGGGPNRIGQGIEFDYCCVHAARACREAGFETIMVNCNPETVSTDFDVSDRLYFEPVTQEDVMEIVDIEKPQGIIIQFGGQTPLRLAKALHEAGAPLIGTSSDAIDRAEDRERCQHLMNELGLRQPRCAVASGAEQAISVGAKLGYPLIARPSYVLGGRAMEVIYSEEELRKYLDQVVSQFPGVAIALDHFLDRAIEVDIDAVCDGREVAIGAIMQHIEQAGVHSGDSACSLPPHELSEALQSEMRDITRKLALGLNTVGMINVQLAAQGDEVYVIEVNPRASRTAPFVSKCIGVSLPAVATRCMLGQSLAEQGFRERLTLPFVSVKEAVFPFNKFPQVDPILGPEMRSTGEVMGVGRDFPEAFAKAQHAAGFNIPDKGCALISVRDADKERAVSLARSLIALGFSILSTEGTAATLAAAGVAVEKVNKIGWARPDIADAIVNRQVTLIINSTEGRESIRASAEIRRMALARQIYYSTTLEGGQAVCQSMQTRVASKSASTGDNQSFDVYSLQSLYSEL